MPKPACGFRALALFLTLPALALGVLETVVACSSSEDPNSGNAGLHNDDGGTEASHADDGGLTDVLSDSADSAVNNPPSCPGPTGLDPTFGDGGIVFVSPEDDTSGGSEGSRLVRSPNGDLTIGTTAWGAPRGVSVRIDANGARVWRSVLPVSDSMTSYHRISGITPLANGGTVLSGLYQFTKGNPTGQFTLFTARLLADGGPDPSFGTNGALHTPLMKSGLTCTENPCVLMNVANYGGHIVQSTGNVVVSGFAFGGGVPTQYLVLGRVLPNGSYDPAFAPDAGGGGVRMDPGGLVAARLFLLPTDKVLAVGGSPSNAGIAFARFTADGLPDTTFGANGSGSVTTALPNLPIHQTVTSAAIDSVGKIVVVGSTFPDQANPQDVVPRSAFIARFNEDGSLDTSFGSSGATVTDFGGLYGLSSEGDVVILSTNEMVTVGSVFPKSPNPNGQDAAIAIARYLPNGALDTRYGDAGKIIMKVGKGRVGSGMMVSTYSVGNSVVADPSTACSVLIGGGTMPANGDYLGAAVMRIRF